MHWLRFGSLSLALVTACAAQGRASTKDTAQLPNHATLPIMFTKTVDSARVKAGDRVMAETTQAVHLADGREVPAGATVKGHVLASRAFRYDKVPYAKQSPGLLELQIDVLEVQGQAIPLRVALRAMADPLSSWGAHEPGPSDLDPLETTTQIGGDRVVPSQQEIHNKNGDVVGYSKKGGTFAHLVANVRGVTACDAGDTEQPMSIFSASACGLYGFTGTSLTSFDGSRIGLTSVHGSPQIWKHTAALLETMPDPTK